ncbi:MAG TPA: class I SAM-dependent methyltransferase [Steroidobacteraceae bacterium]|nr:class I SAM-dependent methyltransferase [Steroidobacteraceae bacterium]
MAKIRDSGVPAQELWESFFDPGAILDALGCRALSGDVVEFGCGYGTFAIPAARRTSGTVFALDIDPLMVAATAARAAGAGLANVSAQQRDFVAAGSGRPAHSVSCALLLNILHLEDPLILLREARRVLQPGGTVGVIHWRRDVATPRGPPLGIRPDPAQCREWALQAGFAHVRACELAAAPWHWGLVLGEH